MAVTLHFYNAFKKLQLDDPVDFDTEIIKVALCDTSYSPSIDDDENFDDLTNELSGGGYTAGGNTLASISISKDNTNDRGLIDAANPSFTSLTATNVRTAVIYESSASAATSPLVCYIDFGANKTLTDGTLTINFNANGIFAVGTP